MMRVDAVDRRECMPQPALVLPLPSCPAVAATESVPDTAYCGRMEAFVAFRRNKGAKFANQEVVERLMSAVDRQNQGWRVPRGRSRNGSRSGAYSACRGAPAGVCGGGACVGAQWYGVFPTF